MLTEALFLLCVSTCDRYTCKHTCTCTSIPCAHGYSHTHPCTYLSYMYFATSTSSSGTIVLLSLKHLSCKLHMFDHAVLLIRQCRVGLGVMGEHGAESIHNRFNVLERTHSNMPNKVNRLKCRVQVYGGRPLPPGFPSKHRQAATCCEES